MPAPLDLADERFVSLTTFRRSGKGVATPVWVARDGDALVVTTPAGSGKVKRLRRDARVQLRPCSRRGAVADDAPVAAGTAKIEAETPRAVAALRGKYGLEHRLVLLVERVLRRSRDHDRVILRIVAA